MNPCMTTGGLLAPRQAWQPLLPALILLFLAAHSLTAQGADAALKARVQELEQQQKIILNRLAQSESHASKLTSELQHLRDERTDESLAASLERHVDSLTEKYQDAVTWQKLVKSGSPIRIYGFVRLDAYYNSARANSIILPAYVLAENGTQARKNDAAFALDARLTRVGIEIDGGEVGNAHLSARIETDFANFPQGSSESRETPRIRLAYLQVAFNHLKLRLGQDWDVISPLLPAVNAELLMWNAGNLGDRRPMLQAIYEGGDPDQVRFKLTLAAGLTGAINNQDLDPGTSSLASSERDGFDSGLPHLQSRAGLSLPSWVEGKRASVGVWGAVAGLETDARFGGQNRFTTWLLGADWKLPLIGPLLLEGEVWTGQALGDFRGGIGQTINTATGAEIRSAGGWAQLDFQLDDSFRLAVGGTLDDPDQSDLGPGFRSRNWTLYLSSKKSWGGGLVSGLDVIYWETSWVGAGIGNMVRINFWTALHF